MVIPSTNIITLIIIVVNHDNENGFTSPLLDLFKPGKSLPVPDDLHELFGNLKGADLNGWDNDRLITYAESLSDISDESREFLKQADLGRSLQDQWNEKTKAGTKFMQKYGSAIKATAASMGVMAAVSVAIWAAMKAWDKVNVTVEEQQEKYDELEESLKSLNDEYNTLSSKDYTSLTKSEKERLSYLEARIEAEKELLDIQKHNIYREEIGKKFTDQFDENNQYTKLANAKNYSVTDGQTYGIGSTEGIDIEKIINSYDRASQSVNKFRSAVTELDADNFE